MHRTYYKKKMPEGLHYMKVIGHVSRKMTAVIFNVFLHFDKSIADGNFR